MLRVNLLNYFHCNGEEAKWDSRKILNEAEKVRIIEDNTRWFNWERYSSRQQTVIKLGGVTGVVRYKGVIKPFMEF